MWYVSDVSGSTRRAINNIIEVSILFGRIDGREAVSPCDVRGAVVDACATMNLYLLVSSIPRREPCACGFRTLSACFFLSVTRERWWG